MSELIFIEKTTHTIMIEELMLGDKIDDFPNLFTYFYFNLNKRHNLDMYIFVKNSNINEKELNREDKYIIVTKDKKDKLNFSSTMKGRMLGIYLKIVNYKMFKKRIKWYRIYNVKNSIRTDELINKYSDRVNITIKVTNDICDW